MPKSTKPTETKERAAVGRERRIALALREVLDATDGNIADSVKSIQFGEACSKAVDVLRELGYTSLESIPKRVAALNDQLRVAVEAGDGNTIAALGRELARAQVGLPPSKPKGEKAAAVGSSSKRGRTQPHPADVAMLGGSNIGE